MCIQINIYEFCDDVVIEDGNCSLYALDALHNYDVPYMKHAGLALPVAIQFDQPSADSRGAEKIITAVQFNCAGATLIGHLVDNGHIQV